MNPLYNRNPYGPERLRVLQHSVAQSNHLAVGRSRGAARHTRSRQRGPTRSPLQKPNATFPGAGLAKPFVHTHSTRRPRLPQRAPWPHSQRMPLRSAPTRPTRRPPRRPPRHPAAAHWRGATSRRVHTGGHCARRARKVAAGTMGSAGCTGALQCIRSQAPGGSADRGTRCVRRRGWLSG